MPPTSGFGSVGLVLARVTIDESGVVRGLGAMGTALDVTDKKVKTSGREVGGFDRALAAMEHRMFSVQKIAAVMLGGFTIAGALRAIISLTSSLVKNTEGFQSAQRAISDYWHEIVLGEDAVVRFTSRLAEMERQAGITGGVFQKLEAQARIHDRILEAQEEVKRQNAIIFQQAEFVPGAKGEGFVVPGSSPEQIEAAKKRLQSVLIVLRELNSQAASGYREVTAAAAKSAEEEQKRADELAKRLEEARWRAINAMGPPEGFDVGKSWFTLLASTGVKTIDEQTSAAMHQREQIDALNLSYANGTITLNEYLAAQQRVWGAKGETFGPTRDQFKTTADLLDQYMSKIGDVQRAVTSAFQSIGSGIAEGLISGHLKGKKLLAGILADLARIALVRAATYLAAAVAAATGLGGAIEGGSPHQFYMAAAKWAAVGVAAGISAHAIGGGGDDRSAQQNIRTADRTFNPEGPVQQPPSLTIIVQGNVIGQDAYVREIIVQVQRQLAQGTGGGKF